MEKETYKIVVDARDSNGKIIRDSNGVKRADIEFDLTVSKDNLEWEMMHIANTIKAWSPQVSLSLEARLHNSISGTWMTMFSLYHDEEKFIKH